MWSHFLLHDSLSPFQVEYDLVGLPVSQYDAHAFGLTTEWEISQDVIFLLLPVRIHYLHVQFLSIHKVHVQGICKSD